MKKAFIILASLLVSLSMFSQKTHRAMGWKISRDIPRNELKLNIPLTIFCSFPEIYYERIVSEDLSVGASLGVGLNDVRHTHKFMLAPYTRWFFGGNSKSMEKTGTGFFIELNAALLSINERIYYADYSNGHSSGSTFGAGMGISVGWKYLSKNNWIGDVFFGLGRDFSNELIYPRSGISIGKRF